MWYKWTWNKERIEFEAILIHSVFVLNLLFVILLLGYQHIRMYDINSSNPNPVSFSSLTFVCFYLLLSTESQAINSMQLSPEGEVNWGIYPPLFTDPEGDSCLSIYQIRWIKKCCFNLFFWNFHETTRHFLSVLKTVNIQGYSELREPIKMRENCYPLIW